MHIILQSVSVSQQYIVNLFCLNKYRSVPPFLMDLCFLFITLYLTNLLLIDILIISEFYSYKLLVMNIFMPITLYTFIFVSLELSS